MTDKNLSEGVVDRREMLSKLSRGAVLGITAAGMGAFASRADAWTTQEIRQAESINYDLDLPKGVTRDWLAGQGFTQPQIDSMTSALVPYTMTPP